MSAQIPTLRFLPDEISTVLIGLELSIALELDGAQFPTPWSEHLPLDEIQWMEVANRDQIR